MIFRVCGERERERRCVVPASIAFWFASTNIPRVIALALTISLSPLSHSTVILTISLALSFSDLTMRVERAREILSLTCLSLSLWRRETREERRVGVKDVRMGLGRRCISVVRRERAASWKKKKKRERERDGGEREMGD